MSRYEARQKSVSVCVEGYNTLRGGGADLGCLPPHILAHVVHGRERVGEEHAEATHDSHALGEETERREAGGGYQLLS